MNQLAANWHTSQTVTTYRMIQSIEDRKKDLLLIEQVLKEMAEVRESVRMSVKKFLEENYL